MNIGENFEIDEDGFLYSVKDGYSVNLFQTDDHTINVLMAQRRPMDEPRVRGLPPHKYIQLHDHILMQEDIKIKGRQLEIPHADSSEKNRILRAIQRDTYYHSLM